MSLALWCLFAAATLHFISKMPLGKAQAEADGGYNNSNPRAQQSALSGWGERALAAHQNQIESFPLFAAGILVAVTQQVSSPWVGYLAVAYVIARVLYLYCYLADHGNTRSLVWAVGFFSSMALLCSPTWG